MNRAGSLSERFAKIMQTLVSNSIIHWRKTRNKIASNYYEMHVADIVFTVYTDTVVAFRFCNYIVFSFVVAIYPLTLTSQSSHEKILSFWIVGCMIDELCPRHLHCLPFLRNRNYRMVSATAMCLKWMLFLRHPICCTVLWNLIKFHERRSKTEIHTWMAQPPNNLQWLMNSEICQILFLQQHIQYIRPKALSQPIACWPIGGFWSLRNGHKLTSAPLKHTSS